MKIQLFLLTSFLILSASLQAQTIYYATPTGMGDGSQIFPTNLIDGLHFLSQEDTLYLSSDMFTIDQPLINQIPSDVVVEGGFNRFNNWTKSGTTTIHRSNMNIEGTDQEQRIGAIYQSSKINFTLIDLKITTDDAPAATDYGISTYGLHFSNCSNFILQGIDVQVGDASAGLAGVNGMPGAPGGNRNGGIGGDGGGFPGSGGAVGAFGMDGSPGLDGTQPCRNGTGGGGGGGAGGQSGVGPNSGVGGNGGADCMGNNVSLGGSFPVSGTAGVNGNPGTQGSNPAIGGFYFQTGSQGGLGTDGTGGTGSGGKTGSQGLSGNGDPGAGGGGGGQGGTAGTGSYGGGGSFGLYVHQNTGGLIYESTFVSGSAGSGGAIGSGGIGGAGGIGGSNARGGDGGDGGHGGNGQTGIAQDIYIDGDLTDVLYVDSNAAAGGNGLSWATAFNDLQSALDIANTSYNEMQIWIAAGTYYPSKQNPPSPFNTDRNVTFYISKNVRLYGGFSGTETDLSERDWTNNITTLSGEIGSPLSDDNAYHILFLDGSGNEHITNNCIIDGLNIEGANANFNSTGGFRHEDVGGGIFNNGRGGGSVCSPSISNCTFSDNYANLGGAIANFGSFGGESNPSIINCTFYKNTDAINNNGLNGTSSPEIVNCTFSSNLLRAIWNSNTTNLRIDNCILWNNEGEIYNEGQNAGLSINNSIIKGGYFGATNKDPLFVDETSGDLRLQNQSPAIDQGNNNASGLNSIITDLDGNTRISSPNPSLAIVDIGAYEVQAVVTGNNTDGDGLLDDFDNCDAIPNVGLHFDGIDDYIEIVDSEEISLVDDFTFEVWIKVADFNGFRGILGKTQGNIPAPYDFYLVSGSGQPRFFVGNGSNNENISGLTSPVVGEWAHLAVVKQGNTIKHYLNGLANGSGTISASLSDNNGPLIIGSRADFVTKMKGSMDELRIWNIARTQVEIHATISNELHGTEPGLVAYYQFNEGLPEQDNSALTPLVVDGSGMGNNGSLINMTPTTGISSNWVFGGPINLYDSDFDHVGDTCDLCPGFDDFQDSNMNGSPDICEFCPTLTNLFVNQNASGLNNGTSWENAFVELQDAIDFANDCISYGNSIPIWVAAGTYRPTKGGNKEGTFQFESEKSFYIYQDIQIYGGFAGDETMVSERNWNINATILDGEIGMDNESNYRIVIIDGTTTSGPITNSCVVDGFHIRNGEAPGASSFGGGAIFNKGDDSGINCSPQILNCIFSNNRSVANNGGAVHNSFANPKFTNCVFMGNEAVFSSVGGAVFNKGSFVEMTNCTFYDNQADDGGAIYNNTSNVIITNCIFWNNISYNFTTIPSNSIYNFISSADITNSIVEGSGGSAAWDMDAGIDAGHNLDTNPFFVDENLNILSLQNNSPAIDMGTNAAANLMGIDRDLNNNLRIVSADMTQSIVDMGAYEFQPFFCHADHLIFDHTVLPQGTYQAIQSIDSKSIIDDPSTVLFKAGSSILMNTDFEINAGVEFQALIEDCTNSAMFDIENR